MPLIIILQDCSSFMLITHNEATYRKGLSLPIKLIQRSPIELNLPLMKNPFLKTQKGMTLLLSYAGLKMKPLKKNTYYVT